MCEVGKDIRQLGLPINLILTHWAELWMLQEFSPIQTYEILESANVLKN